MVFSGLVGGVGCGLLVGCGVYRFSDGWLLYAYLFGVAFGVGWVFGFVALFCVLPINSVVLDFYLCL